MVRVLIVDDSQDHRVILRTWLEHSYEVIESHDTQDAFQRIVIDKPDCVVLDYRMDGVTGFQFLHRLYKELPSMPPIIFISAAMEESLKRNSIALGASACFEKMEIMENPDKLNRAISTAISNAA